MFDSFPEWKGLSDDMVTAMNKETILDWSTGILPWGVRRAILEALANHFQNKPELEPLHRVAKDAVNFYRFSIHSPASTDQCAETVRLIMRQEGGANPKAIANFCPEFPPSFLEDSPQNHSRYFSCRLLLGIWEEISSNAPTGTTDPELKALLELLGKELLEPGFFIPLQEARSYSIDVDNPGTRAFLFWRWQYVQRNADYRQLQQSAQALLQQDVLRQHLPPFDLCEFWMVPPLDMQTHLTGARFSESKAPYEWFEDQVKKLNSLTEKSRERFNMFIAWPLPDYDSEVILQRILSGEFRYWERRVPPSFLIDRPHKVSLKKQTKFDDRWQEFQVQKDKLFTLSDETAPSSMQDVVDYYNTLKDFDHLFSHEVVSRIRLEAEHRAVGLWMWDYVEKHQCTGVEAAEAVVARHSDLAEYTDTLFNRDLRTAQEGIDQAEFVTTVKKRPKKPGRPPKKKGRVPRKNR